MGDIHANQSRDNPNLLTIPPGVPFLETFAKSLLQGELDPNFRYQPEEPHKLARCRIYVPTRRAARALRSEFADQIGHQSVILPDIRALGEVDDDLGFFDNSRPHDLMQDEPISQVQAMLILGELILAWKKALPKAFSEQLQSVPLVAPANPSDALWLAAELLSLLESSESEEIDLGRLAGISLQEHAEWWQLTLEFLKIVREYWPERLQEIRRQSNAQYQVNLLDRQTQDLIANGHDGPVIVAGSTGSLPATARLIKAVSMFEHGAVVLPGLDQEMSPDQWSYIYYFADDQKTFEPSDQLTAAVTQGHPQFGLARLLFRMGLNISDVYKVPQLGAETQDFAERRNIVSKAMLPSAMTTIWANDAGVGFEQEKIAFKNVSLVEAGNDREEAAAIAVAMRLALEGGPEANDPNVALVTPDRNLALKVSIELQKYGIMADDSGGQSLSQSQIGTLLMLALEASIGSPDHAVLASFLKHPFTLFGFEEKTRTKAISVIERTILRGAERSFRPHQISDALRDYLQNIDEHKHIPAWRRNISAEDIQLAITYADDLKTAFDAIYDLDVGLHGQADALPTIAQWTDKTIQLLEAVTLSPTEDYLIWDSEAGQKLVSLLEEIVSCPTELRVTGQEWVQMLEPLLSGQVVKPKTGNHPRVMIWGALEARLQAVDTIILAGLNEGVWPNTSSNDPFLSRSMKSEIGLEPPERRIGLAAHDFQMGMGAKNVILSRSLKSGGAPTVASRWVQRLCAVLSADIVQAMTSRGEELIAFSTIHQSEKAAPIAQRPDPKPNYKYQPISYSFSEISTLRRDPYAVYAKRILKLQPLESFSNDADLRARGTIFHAVLEEFSHDISNHDAADLEKLLSDILERKFAESDLPAETALLWQDRFARIIEPYVRWEIEHSEDVASREVEASARCALPGDIPFQLTGRADRVDLLKDGSVDIIDFKTGTSPSAREARSLLDPQLPLEAYAIMKSGFKEIKSNSVRSLKYVRLKPADRLIVDQVEAKPTKKEPEPFSAEQLGEKAADELSQLLHELYHNKIGFKSRTIPKMDREYTGDYNHLARVSEWSVADTQEDGDHD
ncbi:MAG: double-strand break repair protein AddB [Rhizobiaceae bacterium]|nr:double-strand break repair protein AddB [Rhizobiaceae bacterium]